MKTAVAMASNKFATMLQKLSLILFYAFLEWILIFLLLFNSFFSYLIARFAHYFALKPPCLWCSRVDHLFNPQVSYTDLVCDTHATEISKLAYCSNHGRLAESRSMCADCFTSQPNHCNDSIRITTRIAFFTVENGEINNVSVRCSCCNQSLTRDLYPPPYLLFKPSWDDLKCTHKQKGSLITENNASECKEVNKVDRFLCYIEDEQQTLSDVGSFSLKDASRSESNLQCNKNQKGDSPSMSEQDISGMDYFVDQYLDDNIIDESWFGEEDLVGTVNMRLNKKLDCECNHSIPIQLIDFATTANNGSYNLMNDEEKQDHENEIFNSEIQIVTEYMGDKKNIGKSGYESMDNEESLVLDLKKMKEDYVGDAQGVVQVAEMEESDYLSAQAEQVNDFKLFVDESKSVPLKEFPDHVTNQLQAQDDIPSKYQNVSASEFGASDPCNGKKLMTQEEITKHDLLCMRSESIEAEEEKFPETPTSADLHNKKALLSGMEESLDGSVISEMEVSDAVVTIERMKTALKVERKALSSLYAELEEERSASAIAANQTMAMINRLQEEKAAMQMEALQYQRMMEEQSEYDQEALQLLNELMIKREKEKQELEKELEIYRKRVLEYEDKEKIRMKRSPRNSASCCNSEDIDELSIDLNIAAQDEEYYGFGKQEESNNNSPDDEINLEEIALDCVNQMSVLDDSLAEFEEERLSILHQLKTLEDRLLTLSENELSTSEVIENSRAASMPKTLLPLLEGVDNETEEERIVMEEYESVELIDNKKVSFEEEVDRVYERLQALETDTEFLNNCMSSMQKGDKGMDLLQEILQHLRDLRAVELCVRNISDDHMNT